MSRYTEFDGYWLFGFLVQNCDTQEIDLLAHHIEIGTPQETAAYLAEAKFTDQLKKAGIVKSQIRSARLWITTMPNHVTHDVYVVMPLPPRHLRRDGYIVSCRVEVELGGDSIYRVERTIFASPHDPWIESCSGRTTRST